MPNLPKKGGKKKKEVFPNRNYDRGQESRGYIFAEEWPTREWSGEL